MEGQALDDTVGGRERLVGRGLADGVDKNLGGRLDVESHGGEIISL